MQLAILKQSPVKCIARRHFGPASIESCRCRILSGMVIPIKAATSSVATQAAASPILAPRSPMKRDRILFDTANDSRATPNDRNRNRYGHPLNAPGHNLAGGHQRPESDRSRFLFDECGDQKSHKSFRASRRRWQRPTPPGQKTVVRAPPLPMADPRRAAPQAATAKAKVALNTGTTGGADNQNAVNLWEEIEKRELN